MADRNPYEQQQNIRVAMDKKELLKQFEEDFKRMRKELGFSATLEQLDGVFFLRDFILGNDYVSRDLSRMIARRITDSLTSWNGFLHSLIMPNPANMVNVTESSMFSDEEKEALIPLMNAIMELVSRNTLIGLTKDKAREGEWFDDCLGFWDRRLKKEAIKMMKKTTSLWAEKARSTKREKWHGPET